MTTITMKTKIQIDGIVEGSPPMFSYHKIATRPDGKRKLFAQSVKVMEGDLLARLHKEARHGVEAEVVVEQRFSSEGVSNVLLDFALIEVDNPITVSIS